VHGAALRRRAPRDRQRSAKPWKTLQQACSRAQRRARRLKHHPCTEPRCEDALLAFASAGELAAHRREAHSSSMPRFDRARARPLALQPEPSSLPRGPASANAPAPPPPGAAAAPAQRAPPAGGGGGGGAPRGAGRAAPVAGGGGGGSHGRGAAALGAGAGGGGRGAHDSDQARRAPI